MRKILAFLLIFVLLLSFAACNPANEGNGTTEGAGTTADPDVTTAEPKPDGVMTYAEYVAAAVDASVTVEAYVQATQSWWSDEGQGKITVYLADRDGAYFAYEMACEEADAAKLTKGTKIRVSGYKAEWMGEVEIVDGTFEFLEGADTYVAEAYDVTDKLSSDMLIEFQNRFVAFKGMTVEAMGQDAEGNDIVFYYNWDNSGTEGNDLYFKVSVGENSYVFTVESYLTGKDSDVYKAVKELKVGDRIDMEGFLYWYEGVNPHITSVTAAE